MKKQTKENEAKRGPLVIEVVRKKTQEEQKKRADGNFGLKAIFAFILIAAFFAFTSAKPGITTEEYTSQEIITEKVPRTVLETYNETSFIEKKVPYIRNVCQGEELRKEDYRYDYRMYIDSSLLDGKRFTICSANVTNKENIAGNFTFYAEIIRSDGISTNYQDQTLEIPANGSMTYLWRYETESWKNAICNLKVESIPKITRCDFRPIDMYEIKKIAVQTEKERNRTVLEDIQKTVSVVKTREKQGYVNRLFGYGQPFYLGY